MNNQHDPFALLPLPYAYSALEPFIDAKTMQLHHDRHLRAYVDHLNEALSDCPACHSCSLQQLLLGAHKLPSGIRTAVCRNAGGVYNHEFFFQGMTPGGSPPEGLLLQMITAAFGDYEAFQALFKAKAMEVFGSGYAWLVLSPCAPAGRQRKRTAQLCITTTANQETPLPLLPLVCIDVWEHAYYLKNYNHRANYIDNWFRVADFARASRLCEEAMGS